MFLCLSELCCGKNIAEKYNYTDSFCDRYSLEEGDFCIKNMVNEMKKKILMLVLFCIVMILPAVAAIIAYTSAQNNPVTKKSVTEISVLSPDGTVYLFSRNSETVSDSGEEASKTTGFDCFFNMNSSGKAVSSLPASESEYQCFTVTYSSYNIKSEYKYYITQDPNNSYYLDSFGNYYKISPDSVQSFLSTEYAMCVFPSAAQPTLSVGDVSSVIPQSMEWKFLGYNNEFYDGTVSVATEIPTCNVSGGLELSFDVEPDYLFVEMKERDGTTVFEDFYEKMDPSLFSDNTVYDVTVTAKWYEADGRINFGEGVYKFKANVLSPAVFYLSTSQIQYGDFVIISAKNIVDKSLIGFASDPDIYFTPVFFEYGGYYHAIVPVSLSCIEKNDKADRYSFTLSYGGVYQELDLDVSVRKISKGYPSISLSKINECYNSTTISDFNSVMSVPFANQCDELYWMKDNMLITPTERNVKMGFGFDVILSEADIIYTHEGVDFKVKTNDTVSACLPGKVIFVGETKLSGKTVVIDHGGGLKSLYANMSSQGVKEGDVVDKGQIIGIVGNTGFCSGTSLHFGLYVFDIPVRYYTYETEGVFIAEAVRQNITALNN